MNKKAAFSLLELIFAIVIIGVIASVAIPKFMDTKADAEAATIKQDINTIVTSVRSYVMVGNSVTTFDKVLTLNKNSWENTDTATTTYKDGDTACVTITLSATQLDVNISADNSGTVCTKIKSLGVESASYELN